MVKNKVTFTPHHDQIVACFKNDCTVIIFNIAVYRELCVLRMTAQKHMTFSPLVIIMCHFERGNLQCTNSSASIVFAI